MAVDGAIAHGVDSLGFDSELECTLTAHDLMARAGEQSIDVALVAQIFNAQARAGSEIPAADARETARLLRDVTSGNVRFVARALEVHARDTGYSVDVWLATAYSTAQVLLGDSRDAGQTRISAMPPLFARVAARSLFEALAASVSDRMAVPGHLADSLGANVALYMHARGVLQAQLA
ncbi:MAG: hypothetical protein ACRDKI_05535 [Solirubrobacterales bacterium]